MRMSGGVRGSWLSDREALESPIVLCAVIATQLLLVYDAGALYEVPFKGLHTGGPDALFAGQDNVIEGIFTTLETLHANLQAKAGKGGHCPLNVMRFTQTARCFPCDNRRASRRRLRQSHHQVLHRAPQ